MGTSQIVQEFFQNFNKEDFDWNISKGPVELDKELNEISKEGDFLFYKEANTLINLLEEFEEERFNDAITKNIAVIGERGSGKTSFLKTIKNGLSKKEGYFVFDIVDPNILGSSINILEILISLIYGEVNKCVDFSDDRIIRKQTEIIKNLKDISITLSNLRKEEGYFKENNPPIEVLDDIHTRIKFNEKFENLINNFKEFIEYKDKKKIKEVVLIIDDLDLIKNKEVYNMLNDIQNFLNGNIVLILGYRDSQLLNSVIDGKFRENDYLIKMEQLSGEEIKTQAINMIDKLIPYNNRIDLNIKNDIFTMDKLISEILIDYDKESSKIKNLSKINVEDFFTEAILYKTNLPVMPIDDKEYTQYIFPQNLRGKLQLLELLVKEMKTMEELESQATEEIQPYHMYHENLPKLKKYFYSKLSNILPSEEIEIIKNWQDKPVEKKNYYMYKSIFDRIDLEKLKNKQILNINLIESYNICLGDIYEILETYKATNCEGELDFYYIYVIKIIYSIELLDFLLNSLVYKDNLEWRNKYITLINVKIMPDTFRYCDDNLAKSFLFEYKGENTYINEIIWKILYSDLSQKGEIAEKTRPRSLGSHQLSKLRYRQVFNYGEIGSTWIMNKLFKNYRYNTDPYSFLGKRKYLDIFIDSSYRKNYKDKLIQVLKDESFQTLLIEYILRKKDIDKNTLYIDFEEHFKETYNKDISFNDYSYWSKENLEEVVNNFIKSHLDYEIFDEKNLENSRDIIIKSLLIELDSMKNEIENMKFENYIFYSVFDIDIFTRITYERTNYERTNKKQSIYDVVINKINKFVLNEKINIPVEEKLRKSFEKNNFRKKEGNKYKIFITDYEKPFTNIERVILNKLMPDRYYDGKIIVFKDKNDIKSQISIGKKNLTIKLTENYKRFKKVNELIDSEKYVFREELNINLKSILAREFRNNLSLNIDRITELINKEFDKNFNKKNPSGFKNNLYGVGDNKGIDLAGTNNFMYTAYCVLNSEEIEKIDYKEYLEEYIYRLVQENFNKRTILTPEQRALGHIVVTLGVEDFNSDIYEVKED